MGHVIEDGKEWEEWFGREVLGSMMELPPSLWRKPKRILPADHCLNSDKFKSDFQKFDWTKMLDK
jgi:hypothetical protein